MEEEALSPLKGITGSTVIAYKAIREDWLMRLRVLGLESLRFVSHDQTTFYVGGVLKPTPWMTAARELCARLDATCICTMNDRALPKLSYSDTAGTFDPATYGNWVVDYAEYMADQAPRLVFDYGNEPDASASIFVNAEADFRARYALTADAVTRAAKSSHIAIQMGGGGFCKDWGRARDFAAWAENTGTRLDFLSVHVYGASSVLRAAINTIREQSDVPIWIIESGADWRPNNASYSTPSAQQAWLNDYAQAVQDLGIARWNLHGTWIDPSEPWATEYNCLMNAGGRLSRMFR